jgi:peptidoglycan/LPS O-acetylase OafA/YrhL
VKTTNSHIPQLDGVRGIAILLVLLWHYLPCQIDAEPGSLLFHFRQMFVMTWSGVDLFFVLSGFLITLSLLNRSGQPNYFRRFFFDRICRIFPVYYLLLGLFVLAHGQSYFQQGAFTWLMDEPLPFWSYALFLQNIMMSVDESFGANSISITWSLALEQQFYLLMPLMIRFVPRRGLFVVFVIVALCAPILRTAVPGFHAFVLLPWRFDSLMVGACLALGFRSQAFMAWAKDQQYNLSAVLLIMLLGVGAMSYRPAEVAALRHAWLALTYAILITLSCLGNRNFWGGLLEKPLLMWFGTLSYGIYMYHQAISGLLHGIIRGTEPKIDNLSGAGITCLALIVTLCVAAASYRWIELPILSWGRGLWKKTKVSTTV